MGKGKSIKDFNRLDRAEEKTSNVDKNIKRMQKAMSSGSFTPAQSLMRNEMERGVHQPKSSSTTQQRDQDLEFITGQYQDLLLNRDQWRAVEAMLSQAWNAGRAAL